MNYRFPPVVLGIVGCSLLAMGRSAYAIGLVPTEIMYDPNSDWNGDYAWIELYNPHEYDVDLSNHVFATNRSTPGIIPQGSLIGARSSAVLYGSVVRDPQNDWGNNGLRSLPDMWTVKNGQEINFIPVFFPDCKLGHAPYCEFYLRGQVMRFGLWSTNAWNNTPDFSRAYLDFSFERATEKFSSSFPTPNDSASIYLKDITLDPTVGSHWQLSVPGVDGAYAVSANQVGNIAAHPSLYGSKDVGSPGFVSQNPPVPEPSMFLGAIAGSLVLALKQIRQKYFKLKTSSR
ncbi:lamin tail domain-containing protein [Sphaerothrix gracilis]|uniref:lamin tail domain-containing protein n=1 Tax=Sphaerothrix gracilis TaxID=3151835 RepID=UPI0031FCE1CF